MSWDEALGSFDDMVAESHHCDMYWFPHTDRLLTKRNTRLDDADVVRGQKKAGLAVPGLARRRLPVQHRLRGAEPQPATGRRALIPRMNRLVGPLGCSRPAPTATSPTRSSPRRAAWSSARWSTPSRARSGSTLWPRSVGGSTRPGSGSASRSRSGPPRPTTSPCRRQYGPRLLLPGLPHPSPLRRLAAPTPRTSGAMEDTSCAAIHDVVGRYWGSCNTRTAADLEPAYSTLRLTSWRSATLGSTPTGSSPTTTSSGCSAPERPRHEWPRRASSVAGRAVAEPGGRSCAGVGSAAPEQERVGADTGADRPWCTSGSPR